MKKEKKTWETYPNYKIYELLNDEKTRKKYLSKPFPDKTFSKMFTKAVRQTKKRKMIDNAKQVTRHVLKKMGGFEIDGWKVRTRIEK